MFAECPSLTELMMPAASFEATLPAVNGTDWRDENGVTAKRTVANLGSPMTYKRYPCDHIPGELEIKNAVDATYDSEGSYDEVIYCTVCSKELSREHKTIAKLAKTDISTLQVKLSTSSYTYDGKAKKPSATISGLTAGTDFTVSYTSGRTNVGTYKVTVTGKGKYTGTVVKSFSISKAKNSISIAKKNTAKTYKVKTLKKKAQSFSIGAKAKGGAKVTYKVSKKASSKISVNKYGKVTLKKGAKKRKYVITVTATATKNYKAATKKVTVTVK